MSVACGNEDHPVCAAGAVGQLRRQRQTALTADLHALHALVPPGDDLAGAEAEAERVAAIPRGIELLAARPGHADVVDLHVVAGRCLGAVADDDVVDDEIGRRRGLVDDGRGSAAIPQYMAVAAVFLVSIPIAYWVSADAAKLSWLSLIVINPIVDRLVRK